MPIKKITNVSGKGIVIKGNDMDTDRIIPARFLKEITFSNMGKYAFYDERFDETGNKKIHPFNDEKFRGASILLVNKNFGCGSSREHAPQALMRFGINAVIGESFADIFAGNCSMLGIPTITVDKQDIERLMEYVENFPQKEIYIDILKKEIRFKDSTINISMNESARKSLVEGMWDSTSLMLKSKDEIKKIARKIPYLNDFKI
ncbi:MAG TPA: 3-isopropylmalate dehydratase small subunit [Candidatus Nanoarchaeia archaeon]|nr:3-isopropylmalate dehydratase small subunit [Candidatus Nanoarchaeia archaeon]